MKYGDTLRQRSIPEWGHYNIDYDYLKDLIKHHTTPGVGKALSIPGQGSTTEKAFGDTFFKVLKAQHDRINLFIRSKSGEIERRLDYIGKQLERLQTRQQNPLSDARLPMRTVEKYAKIDADVTKAGEEIRSLSRFRVAQRTGFHKILKKYKRWTKDRGLEHHFKAAVISSPDSFFQLDLGYLLDQYIDVLGAIRAPQDDSGASSPFPDASHRSVTSRLSRAIAEGSDVDFDVALTSIPLGSRGSRATYWIHPDHIVEVEVLLLEHMRLHSSPNTRTTSPKDSSHSTPVRRKSSATADNRYLGNEDDVGLIILDHPEAYALKQNSSTIGSSEETPGALATRAEGTVRWTSSCDVAVVVGSNSHQPSHGSDELPTAKLKRKQLEAALDSDDHRSVPPNGNEQDTTQDSPSTVRKWLVEHNDPRPIASVCSKRTRFVGLHNTFSGGSWATLDRDIYMKSSVHKSLGSDDWFSESRADSSAFPHAVLEIRREGSQSTSLIQHLDRSHLVERIRGFTLESHAVWLCCKPQTMSRPMWLSILETDIRKLPAPVKRKCRKAYSRSDSASQTSPPQTSTSAASATSPYASRNDTSATSASELLDAPLRAFKKKSKRSHPEFAPLPPPEPPTQRYWNEYDNPESGDEGYYIYVDPDASITFPGQEWMEAWARKAKKLLRLDKLSDEESPLLSAADDDGTSDNDTADESATDAFMRYDTIPHNPNPSSNTRSHRGFFTSLFRSPLDAPPDPICQPPSSLERRDLLSEIQLRQREREIAKLQLYAGCLVAAAVLDVILTVLSNTSRRKVRGEADSAIILGVICNLLLLLVAVANMKARHEELSWFHQGVVTGLVIVMVGVDAVLFRWALNL